MTYSKVLEEYYELYFLANRAYEDFARKNGETPYIMFALIILYANPDGISQKDIRDYLYLPKQTISSIIAALKKRGLVEYHVSKKDARSKVITLTETGAARAESLNTKLNDIELASFKKIPISELQQMNDTTRRMLNALVDKIEIGE